MEYTVANATLTVSVIVAIMAVITSIIATYINIRNQRLLERKLRAETITASRLDWVKTVRELVSVFIEIYSSADKSPEKKKAELKLIKSRIELFLFPPNNEDHRYLSLMLEKCVEDQCFSIDELIRASQYALHFPWARMKKEANFDEKSENSVRESIVNSKDYKAMEKLLEEFKKEKAR